ncbi:serine/threonine-protein phosphatase 6 regulatory ankyrin repeat subunit B-like [Uloborus diversus]|uniref:serine/threonine-protein phosphatase 6 regulatory ankyrin repeat subunit B-like n=1 Tax=Uloborus diversus TaxID=327109 RepID=UPI00240A61B2|nr:serine/threonine-protein phosphatase 6 regulatory ankyrin repeat subunit B-like [Uloborus diversus]
MEISVENKLINLRFFSDDSRQDQIGKDYFNYIRERIDIVLQKINVLKVEYSNTEKVDEKFLFIAKFIAQNIHILKRQCKSTYIRLPWEEMEFCLVSFIFSFTKLQEINLFYQITLNKDKILKHLGNFAKELENEKDTLEGLDIGKLNDLPKLKRKAVVSKIISNYPPFEELYNDYQQIRDIYSLEKINDYIKLASSANPKGKEGQIIITRVLQVIGEYLKNTLESPKLSTTTSELLLLSLPKNTREVVSDLRNSLSHANSLSKRTEIEENTDVNFFIGVQNDTKKVGDVITNILYENKIKTIKVLFKKIVNSENLEGIKEVTEALSNTELDRVIPTNFVTMEHENLEKLIAELNNAITEKTICEQKLFNEMNNIINSIKNQSENISTDYMTGFALLKSLCFGFNDTVIDHNYVTGLKFHANKALENIHKTESHSLKEISALLKKISDSVKLRTQDEDNFDKVKKIILKIFVTVEFGTDEIKWIEELREKLNEKGSFIPIHKQRNACNTTGNKYDNQLSLKISELKGILRNNALSDKCIEKLTSYKSNKKLQAVVEMLVLDIMSILDSSKKFLENNLLFLDDNTPLLTGKCLRNHLAHDNTLVDLLLSNSSIAVILNAKKLASINIMKSKKKVGKLVRNDPSKLKDKYDQGLITIINQGKMFMALEEGNLKLLKFYLKNGADINARSINLSTALHFAAKGSSLETIKFVLEQNLDANVKDITGQSPLHVAAAYGRKNIVTFFVQKVGLHVDDLDNYCKTPLHIAAKNGHIDTVEVLLQNGANTIAHDLRGLSPVYYAIINHHLNVAKILLQKDASVSINEATGGFTPLHEAAERGNLELVNFLLQNEADVNARNDRDWTALHAAAFNGHLEIVDALILKGANVSATVINGCTSLHYAVESGHEKITKVLLKHGANVDAVDKTCNNTPLHYAAKYGQEEIVKILLENKANAGVCTVTGMTPLHVAAKSGNLGISILLLEHGVNIHAKDKINSTPLFIAAERDHQDIAELLIKNGADINSRAFNDLTPLHITALKGHKNIIDLLVRNKVEVNAKDINGRTALHAAAQNGSKDVIDLLIKNKAEVNARNSDGMTPLQLAALKGHGDAIVSLIKNKADVNTKANNGLTPLHAAVVEGHKDAVSLLLKNEAEVDAKGIADSTPLHVAAEAGYKEIVEILVANGADVNINSSNLTPLLCAIKCNMKEIVEILVSNGADVNAIGNKPIELAVIAGFKDIVEILLKNKACINMKFDKNLTLLHFAASRGHKEIVNALITEGAHVDALDIEKTTPLHLAAAEGHVEIVKLLLMNGADVNAVNIECAPLHRAAGSGHKSVVDILLKYGAKIKKDNENRTPFELAVSYGHLQIVKMLQQHEKVDMNAQGNGGWTVLHIASQGSSLEMVKYLVDEGSNVNAKNASGSKPIHIAAREGKWISALKAYRECFDQIKAVFGPSHQSVLDIIKKTEMLNFMFKIEGREELKNILYNQKNINIAASEGDIQTVEHLLKSGLDVNVKDNDGRTSLHYAANNGHLSMVNILLKNGADITQVTNKGNTPLHTATSKGPDQAKLVHRS